MIRHLLVACLFVVYEIGTFRLARTMIERCPRFRRPLLIFSSLVIVAAAWIGLWLPEPVPDNPARALAVAFYAMHALDVTGGILFLLGLPILVAAAIRPSKRGAQPSCRPPGSQQ